MNRAGDSITVEAAVLLHLEAFRMAGVVVGWVRDGAIIPGGCCDSGCDAQ